MKHLTTLLLLTGFVLSFFLGMYWHREANVHTVFPLGSFKGGNTYIPRSSPLSNDYYLDYRTLRFMCELLQEEPII